MRGAAAALLLLALAAGCGQSSAPGRERVAPGEEPLETETLAEEEVKTLEPEQVPRGPAQARPCAWAKAWSDPAEADPLLAGVGGVPNPEPVSSTSISIPVREPAPSGRIAIEIVVRPDGSVAEARIVSSSSPLSKDIERAILEAVRSWRYEPPRFDGTPVAVCTTVEMGL